MSNLRPSGFVIAGGTIGRDHSFHANGCEAVFYTFSFGWIQLPKIFGMQYLRHHAQPTVLRVVAARREADERHLVARLQSQMLKVFTRRHLFLADRMARL